MVVRAAGLSQMLLPITKLHGKRQGYRLASSSLANTVLYLLHLRECSGANANEAVLNLLEMIRIAGGWGV
jgi:hypothetical protein